MIKVRSFGRKAKLEQNGSGGKESKLNASESVTKCIEFCGGASPLYDFTNLK